MANDSSDLVTIAALLRKAREATEYLTAQAELKSALAVFERLDQSQRAALAPNVYMSYAMVAESFGDLETAIDYHEKLALERADSPLAHLALATLYRQLGDAVKAEDSANRCEELAERSDDKTALAALAAQGHLPRDAKARARRLEDAVVTSRGALREFTFDKWPDLYAATQKTIGSLCRQQADLLAADERIARLDEAAAAYREALKVRTANAYPEENHTLLESLQEIEKARNQR